MTYDRTNNIAQSLLGYQSALKQGGDNFEDYITRDYIDKWCDDTIFHALAVRTTFVHALHTFLVNEGLFNLEKVMLSIITDPLAHDVEHTPAIDYKGQTYVTTHSMIYAKFLACFNDRIKGVFVDSPNIRLEIEHPNMVQRGKYLIDFSQMDIEVKRNRNITYDDYLGRPEEVKRVLAEDMETAKDFFERMLIYAMGQVVERNDDDLKKLNIAIEVPTQPFPSFRKDELDKRYGSKDPDIKAGETTDAQFYWVTGLLRENYDLVYPYLLKDGKVDLSEITSANIYNYDICAKSIIRDVNKQTPALEILSGAIREWLYEPIVERLLDNRIISCRPIVENGNIDNIDEIGGYGPFLLAAQKTDPDGKNVFPDTFGGGIGIERTLYAILKGTSIEKIDDITFFGKNPDSHQIYLF